MLWSSWFFSGAAPPNPIPDPPADNGPAWVEPLALANRATSPRTVEVDLVAQPLSVSVVEGKQTELLAYNGQIPGPTLDVTEGDRVVVHFTNRLSEPTTIHWHGLHVPADQDGNPMDPVAPGARRDDVFDIPAGSAGTFWYHPHPDHLTAKQACREAAAQPSAF